MKPDPLIEPLGDLAIARFEAKIDKSAGPDKCWLWTAGTFLDTGYGAFAVRRRARGAHRVAYRLANGPIPADRMVCHTCDNRLCVNPTHLFLGDQVVNMADMVAKGRSPRGLRNPQRKLNPAAVREIRRRQASAGESQASLARDFGVSKRTIHGVIHRETWGHVVNSKQGGQS